MTLSVAALQFCPRLLDCDANRQFIERALRSVDAELLVLPELCTSGYFFPSFDALFDCAESLEGISISMLRDAALSEKRTIVAGWPERNGERVYNSACTILPDGRIEVYRKVHLFAKEKELFEPGDLGFPVAHYEQLNIGTMICYDWRFPEAARTLALRGASIICHPSDLVALPQHWGPVMQTRSFENKVYTITANRTGTETLGESTLTFHGCSQITDISGSILARADETFEGWIHAEVDVSKTRSKSISPENDLFGDRRPSMYSLS